MEQENARSNNTADKRTEGSIEANIAAPGVSQNRTSLNQVTPKSKEPTAHHKWKEQFYCHAGFSELGIAWFTFFLFSATGALWFVTYSLARDAKEGAEEQATNMSKSIAEAANAANAMKEIAAVTKENATLMEGILRKQMRAYIAVDIGGATYQDANLRFEAAPVIVNTGNTPAKHVSYKMKAAVLNAESPEALSFEEGEWKLNDAVLHPRQSFVVRRVVNDRVPDNEVAAIMGGEMRRLYIWGTVTYEDIFGGKWETNFCHNYIFYGDPENIKTSGFYHPKYNNAT